MSIAFVTVATGGTYNNGGPFDTASDAFVATAGNLIVACVNINDVDDATPSNVTMTDTAGNTYTRSLHGINGATNKGQMLFYATNILGHATNVVTAHTTSTAGYMDVIAIQFSGVTTSSPLDASPAVTNSYNVAGPLSTGTFSTVQADEVAVAFIQSSNQGGSNDFTAGSGYTIPSGGKAKYPSESEYTMAVQYQVFASTQSSVTASMDFTGSASSRSVTLGLLTFKAAAGGSSTSTGMGLLTVGIGR